MLTLRFLRSGRKNQAFFRIVLTEKSKPSDSGFIKALGWYNPHTKEVSLEKEEILEWLNKGAKPSNSLAKLLLDNKIKHKQIVFVKNAKAEPKKKSEKKEKPKMAEKAEEDVDVKEEVAEKPEEKSEEEIKEAPTSEVAKTPVTEENTKEDIEEGK